MIYFIDGEKPALIDTGMGDAGSIEFISSELKEAGRSLKDIFFLINTHAHIEHFGGNQKIINMSGSSVIASSAAAPMIENFHEFVINSKEKLSNQEFAIMPLFRNVDNFHLSIEGSKVDIKVKDSDIIDLGKIQLRVIDTPGHADGHICLYDAQRKILFSGDHIISYGSSFVGFSWRELAGKSITDIFNADDNTCDKLSQYLESIERLMTLELKLILPGHGDPVTEPYKKLEKEIKGKLRREAMFLEAVEREKVIELGRLTADVYGENGINFLHQGAALGYLQRLSRAGKITAEMRDNELFIKSA